MGVCLLIGELGRWHWFADLFAQFRWQGVVGLALAAILAVLGRRRRVAGVAIAGTLLVAATALPWRRDSGDVDAVLRVASINLHLHNPDAGPLLAWLDRVDPDVVVVQELTPALNAGLSALQQRYPVRHSVVREDPFGIGIWSRLPGSRVEVLELAGFGSPLPALRLRLALAGQPLQLYGVHPPPPLGADLAQVQAEQFEQLRQLIASASEPAAIVGDLNASPWGQQFRLLRQSGLDDHGLAAWPPSWRPPLPWTALALPLDHGLVQPPWQVRRRECGPAVGSDHCPLLLEFAVQGAR